MRGAPARAIQELAGHQDLGTTQRYMHLSPAALDAAIRLLDDGGGAPSKWPLQRGEIEEAAGKQGFFDEIASKNGGGGGSRTRVRRHIPAGLYMRVRFFNLAPSM